MLGPSWVLLSRKESFQSEGCDGMLYKQQVWGWTIRSGEAGDAPVRLRATVFSEPGSRARMHGALNLCELESNLSLAVLKFGMLRNLKLKL